MRKILFSLCALFWFGPCLKAHAKGLSKAEMDAYLKGCKRALSQAKPNWDPKDVDMLCADPYLKGKPHESAADKRRRMRLIKKTNEDKNRTMAAAVGSEKSYLDDCQAAFKASDPKKDPEDVKMLCENPYLTPKENESAKDKLRRMRLIRESDVAKEETLNNFVAPPLNEEKPIDSAE